MQRGKKREESLALFLYGAFKLVGRRMREEGENENVQTKEG